MLGTSYDKVWRLYSRSDSEPSAETATSQVSVASLAALRLSFDPMNTHDLIFDAELGEGQHSFAIGADANIGNEITSSDSADEAVLAATVKNGELQQIAMMGVAKVADAADDTPSFVLAPITQASYYWIGDYDSRRIFEYNTGSSSYIKETAEINGQNAASLVEGIDSGLTMSWTNVEDGGHIGFKFSVGAVADVGAVTGQVDYITENLTDLDGDTSYIITVDGESYEIVSDMYGDIALEGTDDNDVSYSLFGKNISISKKDSQDTPADITVAARPEAPSAPKTLADIQNPTPADMESAADGEGIEIVSVTGDSVTVSPLGGQQYQYSMDGAAWTVLDDLNVSDNYVISGLEENQRVYVRTRYVANTTRPASLWSDAKAVSRDLIAGVTAEDTTCTYDGLIHSPSVTIADGLDGASISYSLAADEPYTQTVPELKNAGTYKVYYLVTADECSPVFGDVTVTIEKKTITADKVIVDENAYIQGIQFSGLLDGDELVYDEDYTVVLWDVTPGIETIVTTYRFGLATTGNAANYILQNKSWDMVHHHDWTYEIKEGHSNKIIAYCNETENPAHCAYQGRNEAVSCTVTAESRAYDGTEYAGAVVNNWITEKTGEAAVTYYEGTGDTDYPENENAPVNAGTYKFVVKIADVTAYAEFEIQRLDQNVEFDVSDYTFGDSIEGPKVTGSQEDPVIEYYYTTENSNTDGTLWENSRSADPGTYYMYAKVCATTNYNEYVTQPVQFTVAKREIIPAATTLKVGKVAAKTYGDAKFALNVKCSRNDKKTFTSSNTKVVKVDGTGKVTIVGAGKAVVTVSVAANQNYKAAAAKVAITVNPKAIRVTANDASKYEGKADPKFTFTAEGLVGKDKLTGIVLKRAAGEKSGTYTITASQKKGANPNYNITFAIGRLVIKKSPNVEPSGTELYKKTLPFFLMKGKGTGTRIDLTWDKVKGATGYDVYWSYCNGKNNFNKLANVPKSQKYADKNLNNKREYKYFTVAYKMSGGKKVYLGRTNTVHVAMPQASKTNVLKVTVNKTKVNLAKGKTFKITKKVKLENPKKKALNHLTKKERFITSNAKVATVSSAGVIKAVRKGTCTVYVMSENGVCAKIKVTVK
ncbi:MBG domain-containing protein [Coprococcus sp. OM06-25]|nr:MBG domain-containing protein [Coprococcus sp. OM06-25]